jgi:hypothetical protein
MVKTVCQTSQTAAKLWKAKVKDINGFPNLKQKDYMDVL